MEEETKKYKPEPPKPLKDTELLRYKLDVIRANAEAVIEQIDSMKEDIDSMEARYKSILEEHPVVKPEPVVRHGDELDQAFDELLK